MCVLVAYRIIFFALALTLSHKHHPCKGVVRHSLLLAMNISRSVPNDEEYCALAALATTNADFFVSKAVCVASSGNTYRMLMVSETLEPITVQQFVVDDMSLKLVLPTYNMNDLVHKVVNIVGMYLGSEGKRSSAAMRR